MPTKNLHTPFQVKKDHSIIFGLEIIGRNELTNEVTEVECKFCRHFGRERLPGKRKKSKTITTFRNPFRADSYRRHLQSCHPSQWSEYALLSKLEKRKYWGNNMKAELKLKGVYTAIITPFTVLMIS